MALVSYQTITLSKGKHASPHDGACVMELASMLAGEPFNDHPQSVCPVIGSFLRAYNDRIDDARRQDLYAYAAKVIDSRAPQDVQHARAERLSAWALELHWSRRLQRLIPAQLRALVPRPSTDLVGSHAVCAIPQHSDRTHAEVLDLIDELLTIGAGKQPTIQQPQNDDANARLPQSPQARVSADPYATTDTVGTTGSSARRPGDAQPLHGLSRHRRTRTRRPLPLLRPRSVAEEPAPGQSCSHEAG
jgi:hypothetical protein